MTLRAVDKRSLLCYNNKNSIGDDDVIYVRRRKNDKDVSRQDGDKWYCPFSFLCFFNDDKFFSNGLIFGISLFFRKKQNAVSFFL